MIRTDPAGALLETRLPLPNRRQGKVRDLYDCPLPDGDAGLLIVASDRVSAFDVVMANGIPDKGRLLTAVSTFWFDRVGEHFPHHLVGTDVDEIPGVDDATRDALRGRIMLCRRLEVVPVECVARGYLAGSGWAAYLADGGVCGIALPAGLRRAERLPEPLFTPATKARTGHDENVSFEQAAVAVGADLMAELRARTLALYAFGREHAAAAGLILADTKFEFGIDPASGEIRLADEILTPDSSRYWEASAWRPGEEPPSFDKQIVRNHLQARVDAGAWDKTPPGPALPVEIIERTRNRYIECHRRLTGADIALPG